MECKDLDIVYIALPHSLHHEWVIKSIEKGKNILVEKPATVNFSQMENIKNNLKNKNIFFSEAFMYRYHPQISKVVDLLKNNVIGNLVSMESLFGFDALGRKKIFGIKLKYLSVCVGAKKDAKDYIGLQKLPKNASPVRLHNRCKITGRPKGYIRQFGLSRVMFREMANKGLIPGVTKASW